LYEDAAAAAAGSGARDAATGNNKTEQQVSLQKIGMFNLLHK
jgi:hypothetical protein